MSSELDIWFRRTLREESRSLVREELRAALAEVTPRNDQSPADPAAEFLPVPGAARTAAVHERTIRRWISEGHLTAYRAGRVYRIRRRELEDYLARAPREACTTTDIQRRAREILASHG